MHRRFLFLPALALLAIAGCYGKPIPHIDSAPADCSPVKVLLVGDSLMQQTEHAIIDELHAAGYPVEALVVAHGGSNAVEYAGWLDQPADFTTPRDELQHSLDEFHPDVVLVDWGINAVGSLPPELQFLVPWAVQSAMRDVVDLTNESGAKLYWTTIPWRGDDLAVYANDVNTWIQALNVPLVDWRAALSTDDGIYAQFLKYPEDDGVRPVRTEDGVHFTQDGIDRVAQWTVATLAPDACGAG